MMKNKKIAYIVLSFIGIFFLLWINDYSSYCRRIGDTRFYLVETMAVSKDGRIIAGLYYRTLNGGFSGEYTPGFPKIILWNDRYLISKNYDGNNPVVLKYIVINMDSVKPDNDEFTDIHIFTKEEDYYDYLQQINLSESNMKQTDNHIAWWDALF